MLIGIISTKQIPSLSMQPMPLFELYKWRPSGRGTLLLHADPQNLSPRDPVACLQRDLGLFLGDLLHGLNVFQTHSNVPALETTASWWPISWHGPTSCWEATIISCHLFVLCLLTMCIVKFLAGSCLNYELALLISGDVMASKFDQMIHQLEAKFPKGHCNVWTKMCLFKSCVGCGSSNHFTRLSIWPSR
jgi:hypothetical protein